MSQKHITHTLANGLRIVHIPTQSAVGYCGLAVNAGSRDEVAGQFGLAHFVEHTIFKGTDSHKANYIINRMEAVGGELNAYTTKESTVVYSVFPAEHYARAITLIADLVTHSNFPSSEIEREREVVLEEAASYRDSPMDAAYDDFEDYLFAGSMLGHNILGTENDVAQLSSDDCLQYLKNQYTPSNMVLFAQGNMDSDKLFALAEKTLGMMHHPLVRCDRQVPTLVDRFEKKIDIDAHQSHTVMGTRLFDMHDDRRYAMSLLNNIIGGPGMNSLLNVQLRERRGYVYTVESSLSLMTDCGMFQVYFGCDHDHVKHSRQIVERTLTSLAETTLSETKLAAAKRQYCGQLLVAGDNAENCALSAGRSMLYYGSLQPRSRTIELINSVSAEQLRMAAELIAPANCSVLTME